MSCISSSWIKYLRFVFLPFLLLVNEVVFAACEDLYADPPDVAAPPPVEIDEVCYYGDLRIDLGVRTYINNEEMGLYDNAVLNIEGSEFISNGYFFNYGSEDVFGEDVVGTTEIIINGYRTDGIATPVEGRFIVRRELYNGYDALIEIGLHGSLEGDGGTIINRGLIYNASQVEVNGGRIDNQGGILQNESQWSATNVLNQGGELINMANADWFVNSYLANYDSGILNNAGNLTNQGIVENRAILNNSGILLNLFDIYLQDGALNLTDGFMQNEGSVNFDGGQMVQTGGMLLNRGDLNITQSDYLLSAGSIDNHGIITDGGGIGTMRTSGPANGKIRNYAIFDISNSLIVSDFENAAGMAAIDDTLTAQAVSNTGGQLVVGDTLKIGQSLEIAGGSVTARQIEIGAFANAKITGGTLSFDNFVGDLSNISGRLAPGNTPGTSLISGDYEQLADAILQIEIGGLIPGVEHDVLAIEGTAVLGGTLELLLYDFGSGPFKPTAGDSFEILSAETVIGEFRSLSLAMLDEGLSWDIEYFRDGAGSDYVRLVVSAVPVPAAVWLFGTALIGLVGFRKRKKAA